LGRQQGFSLRTTPPLDVIAVIGGLRGGIAGDVAGAAFGEHADTSILPHGRCFDGGSPPIMSSLASCVVAFQPVQRTLPLNAERAGGRVTAASVNRSP